MLRWSDPDGSVPYAVAHVDGPRFDAYTIYDAIGLDYAKDAELMRQCLTESAKTYEVEFPDGERRRYKTLATARRAIERHAARWSS